MFDQDMLILKNLTILFVEDDPIAHQEMYEVLSYCFKKVYTFMDGMEAFRSYEENSPDIILSDISMPGMDGLELAKTIRKNDCTTPFIFITGVDERDTLLEAINSQVDGYLLKPVTYSSLINALKRAIRRLPQKNTLTIDISQELQYNTATQTLLYEGNPVQLGTKELQLFQLFLKNANSTLHKKDIEYAICPLEAVTDSAFKNLLSRLRQKIGFHHITTVKGAGWRLIANPSVQNL